MMWRMLRLRLCVPWHATGWFFGCWLLQLSLQLPARAECAVSSAVCDAPAGAAAVLFANFLTAGAASE
jgi:hypothetical protein